MKITIKVSPRAQKTEFCGKMTDQTLKFKVKAPPEKGAANKVLTAYLSKALNLRQEEVKINTGKNSRVKILELPDHTSLPW